MSIKNIAFLSDVAIGYGSPQILNFAKSLRANFSSAQITIYEPDQKGCAKLDCEIAVKRILTRLPPYDEVFQIEFNRAIARELNQIKPEIIVVQNAWVLPSLLLLNYRPKQTIYYMLEPLAHQRRAGGEYFIHLNKLAGPVIDIVISPEANRLRLDMESLGWNKPSFTVLNTPKLTTTSMQSNKDSNTYDGLVISAGTISRKTLIDSLCDNRLKHLKLGIAGPADSAESRELIQQASNFAHINYLGFVKHSELNDIRARYKFSLVGWLPDNEDTFFACPNKFFESVASGVPVICAPHPQCVELIKKYHCGLLLEDWNHETIVKTIIEANYIPDVEHELMRANCFEASQSELNWDTQISPVIAHLKLMNNLNNSISIKLSKP